LRHLAASETAKGGAEKALDGAAKNAVQNRHRILCNRPSATFFLRRLVTGGGRVTIKRYLNAECRWDALPDQNNAEGGGAENAKDRPSGLPQGQLEPTGSKEPERRPEQEHAAGPDRPVTNKTLLGEIRVIDVINVIVGIGMLVVAFAAYRVASDTRDVKSAVQKIAELTKETKRQANASQDQLTMLKGEQRPWLGPIAGRTDKMIAGAGVKTIIEIANFGKSPAKYAYALAFRVFTREEWSHGAAFAEIAAYGNECMSKAMFYNTNDTMFPSNPSSGKTFRFDTSAASNEDGIYLVNGELIDGNSIFIAHGCIVYTYSATIGHTSFCYKYDAKETVLPTLDICTTGNEAN
jgi:hypothetical protein